jgi:ribosomal protein S18 acetylase RimI-like enzyme
MGNVIFSTLKSTDVRDIYSAFVCAFSDYSVSVDMPFDKFTAFIKANGFDPALSAGAFIDGRLCGFILNGIRNFGGMPAAYDGGTGVIPECRKQGLTTGMFEFCAPLLKGAGIRRYVLEVIQTNEPALRLYKSFGFSVVRELVCYRIKRSRLGKAETKAHVIDVSEIDTGVKAFWDYSPTWQNTFDSINAVPQQCAAAIVEQNGKTAGYGIINTRTGSVYQLAVEKACRGCGAGRDLINKLVEQTEAEHITFINVDEGCGSMRGFLEWLGFEEYVRQYEMALDI